MKKSTWLILSVAALTGLCVVCGASAVMVQMSRPNVVSYFSGEDEVRVTLSCPTPSAERDEAAIEARLRQMRVVHELEVLSPTELRLHVVGVDPEFTRYLTRRGHIEFIAILDEPGAQGRTLRLCEQGACTDVVVAPETRISNEHIANAEVFIDPNTNAPSVSIGFTGEGGARFASLTTELVGRRLAIVLDDTVMSAPRVQEPITGGRAVITMGSASEAEMRPEAEAIALALRGGVPLECAWTITSEEHIAH
jgi:preprotein translocase subunit SecD